MAIEQLKDKKDCCGCGACVSVCPFGALELIKDEVGHVYPQKNADLCVDCGLCEKVCNFSNDKNCAINKYEKKAYAMISKDTLQAIKSASGGVFAKIAELVIHGGGSVCGAAWDITDAVVRAKHIIIDKESDIKLLQGSKYVQSEIGDCYIRVQKLLKSGKQVLFSGTPCQVDGLRGFLQKEYENLVTVDIVCHGVPSSKMLSDYLNYKWGKYKVVDISFRDKKMGWGMTGYVRMQKDEHEKTEYITPKNSSYFSAFIKGVIYRQSCYSCPYANEKRPADITICDYWGAKEEHPAFVALNDGAVSAVIVNSPKGESVVEELKNSTLYCASEFRLVAKHNSQLRGPSVCPSDREKLLADYAINGYTPIEKYFRHNHSMYSITKENLKLLLKSRMKSMATLFDNHRE